MIVQINLKSGKTRKVDYEAAVCALTDPLVKSEGIVWKMWLVDDNNRQTGIFHLFESSAAAQAYLDSPTLLQVSKQYGVQVKAFSAGVESGAFTTLPVAQARYEPEDNWIVY